jgi:hypothetical protein
MTMGQRLSQFLAEGIAVLCIVGQGMCISKTTSWNGYPESKKNIPEWQANAHSISFIYICKFYTNSILQKITTFPLSKILNSRPDFDFPIRR